MPSVQKSDSQFDAFTSQRDGYPRFGKVARQKLTDLLTKLDGNDELERLLQEVINNTEELQQIKDSTKQEPLLQAQDDNPSQPVSEEDN